MAEFIIDGLAHYMKAPLPPNDMKDLKAMCVQRTLETEGKVFYTAQDVLRNIPDAAPVGADWLFKSAIPGTFTCVADVYEKLPELDWNQLYNLVPMHPSKV